MVRFAKDKGAGRFVDVVQRMSEMEPGFWERTGVVPLMVGAASSEWALEVKRRFKQAVPCGVVVDRFLSPEALADVLVDSVLSLHPSLYEAFGMTIVEAAACGVPSVINVDGIGASQLLDPSAGASIAANLKDVDGVAGLCMQLLGTDDSRRKLREVGSNAYIAAVSWTEEDHAASLLELVDRCAKFRATR